MKRPLPTEHGLSMYRRAGCKCDVCRAANAVTRMKYKKPARPKLMLPCEPLVNLLTRLERLDEVDHRALKRWEVEGVWVFIADVWCTRLGYHPAEVFGNAFYAGCFDEEFAA